MFNHKRDQNLWVIRTPKDCPWLPEPRSDVIFPPVTKPPTSVEKTSFNALYSVRCSKIGALQCSSGDSTCAILCSVKGFLVIVIIFTFSLQPVFLIKVIKLLLSQGPSESAWGVLLTIRPQRWILTVLGGPFYEKKGLSQPPICPLLPLTRLFLQDWLGSDLLEF